MVAVIEDVGASGAYYIACGSDTILAHPTSVTGSIGVIVGVLVGVPVGVTVGVFVGVGVGTVGVFANGVSVSTSWPNISGESCPAST